MRSQSRTLRRGTYYEARFSECADINQLVGGMALAMQFPSSGNASKSCDSRANSTRETTQSFLAYGNGGSLNWRRKESVGISKS